jgi:dCMP deaminase
MSDVAEKNTRPTWDEYFMGITAVVASRSTCVRRKVGAVIVKEKRILASGYNGAPSSLEHCLERGCLREAAKIPSGERQELCRGIHAEQNAVVQAAAYGVAISGAVIYCTHQPCSACTKILINAGIKRIFYRHSYPDKLAVELLREAGIECSRFE